MRGIWVGALVLAGCLNSASVVCGDSVCATGTICGPDGKTCATRGQLDACDSLDNYTTCEAQAIGTGVCIGQVCVSSNKECGDGVVEPALGEQCDCGSTVATSVCAGLNSEAPGAECRTDCTVARCGDGIVDTGEGCDDGNTIGDDGCRADCAGRFRRIPIPSLHDMRFVWANRPTFAVALDATRGFFRWDGVTWTALPRLTTSSSSDSVTRLWGLDETHIYAATFKTGVWMWDGTQWNEPVVAKGDLMTQTSDVWGTAPNDLWAIGYTSTPKIYHYDGTRWSEQDILADVPGKCAITAPFTVRGTASDNVAIFHSEGVCIGNGTSWTRASTNFISLGNVEILSTGLIVASEFGGVVTHLYIGDTFSDMTNPARIVTVPGTMLSFAPVDDRVLVVGQAGGILEYAPTTQTWTNYLSSTEQTLVSISGTAFENVFIAGTAGTILH